MGWLEEGCGACHAVNQVLPGIRPRLEQGQLRACRQGDEGQLTHAQVAADSSQGPWGSSSMWVQSVSGCLHRTSWRHCWQAGAAAGQMVSQHNQQALLQEGLEHRCASCPKVEGRAASVAVQAADLTCHDDGLPEAQQHEGQSGCCVGHGVCAMHNQKGIILLPAAGQVSSDSDADQAAETHHTK